MVFGKSDFALMGPYQATLKSCEKRMVKVTALLIDKHSNAALKLIKTKFKSWIIGEITKGEQKTVIV
jgi:hypothetical protein